MQEKQKQVSTARRHQCTTPTQTMPGKRGRTAKLERRKAHPPIWGPRFTTCARFANQHPILIWRGTRDTSVPDCSQTFEGWENAHQRISFQTKPRWSQSEHWLENAIRVKSRDIWRPRGCVLRNYCFFKIFTGGMEFLQRHASMYKDSKNGI